jgi:hypothetical protein
LPHILNTEELASIWHFPVEASVKAPLIQKVPGKKAEPPASLPISMESAVKDLKFGGGTKAENIFDLANEAKQGKPGAKIENLPPDNLPIV